MTGRWMQTGPGRSVWRPDLPELIGPDALEPLMDPQIVAAMRRSGQFWEGQMQRLGKSQGERERAAAEMFGDGVRAARAPLENLVAPRPAPDDPSRPVMVFDRRLVNAHDFATMASGMRTFYRWLGSGSPRCADVLVLVEHFPYAEPSTGRSVAFEVGSTQVLEENGVGLVVDRVLSLRPLRGISLGQGTGRWGWACADCGWWFVGEPSFSWENQADALMHAAGHGMTVTVTGLRCPDCVQEVPLLGRGRVGYELRGGADA